LHPVVEGVSDSQKRQIERYLDSTRAELFFAKKILLVEGLSEAILLPVLAKLSDVDLKEESVTIINVQGLGFATFLPLFLEEKLCIPVSILTDGDPDTDAYPSLDEIPGVCDRVTTLKENESETIKVFNSKKTLEYDLALPPENMDFLVQSFTELHPQLGRQLQSELSELSHDLERTIKFYTFCFTDRKTSKPEFVQVLCEGLSQEGVAFVVPDYIQRAVGHLTRSPGPIVGQEGGNGQ